MNKHKIFVLCCILIIALLGGLLIESYVSHRDDKLTIGRMLAYALERQRPPLSALQHSLENSNDDRLPQQMHQLESILAYNFFETGVRKLEWNVLYMDLFMALETIISVEEITDSERDELRRDSIALIRQIYEKLEEIQESCQPEGFNSEKMYLNYYKLMDRIFYR